jgi:hypothetical protein
MALTIIESEKVELNYSAEKIFNFLSDFNNFGKLMPSQVTNWTCTGEDCTFTISGMATIGMKITEKVPSSKIVYASNGKVPFDFQLIANIVEKGENSCVGQLTFESDMNPMIKMMAERPLGNFFNLLAQKMKDLKL